MTLITPVIASFTGSYAFLSNFAESPIRVEEFMGGARLFPTAEHLFHASKALFAKDVPNQWVDELLTTTAYGSKKMGRALRIDIKRWDAAAYTYMHRIQVLKYTQNPDLKTALTSTKDYVLIEGNDHNDKKWGQVAGVGTNWLGLILMDVRAGFSN